MLVQSDFNVCAKHPIMGVQKPHFLCAEHICPELKESINKCISTCICIF